jgi:hypothetical protein
MPASSAVRRVGLLLRDDRLRTFIALKGSSTLMQLQPYIFFYGRC